MSENSNMYNFIGGVLLGLGTTVPLFLYYNQKIEKLQKLSPLENNLVGIERTLEDISDYQRKFDKEQTLINERIVNSMKENTVDIKTRLEKLESEKPEFSFLDKDQD